MFGTNMIRAPAGSSRDESAVGDIPPAGDMLPVVGAQGDLWEMTESPRSNTSYVRRPLPCYTKWGRGTSGGFVVRYT